jgi:hypothetical protein
MRFTLLALAIVMASATQFPGVMWVNAARSSPPPAAAAQVQSLSL